MFYLYELPDQVHKCAPIRDALEIDKELMDAILLKFDIDGLIRDIAEIEEEDGYFGIRLSKKGRLFAIDGGYKSSERRLKNSRAWKIIQNVIIGITAVATVFIGISQCATAKQANDIQIQINKLKHQ